MDVPELTKISGSDVNVIISATGTVGRLIDHRRLEVKIVKSQFDSTIGRSNNRPGTKFPVGIAMRIT